MTESTETTITQTVEPVDRIGALKRIAEILLMLEIHAFGLLLMGALLTIKGHKDEGLLVMGGAMGIFKGKA
jgi:hypothetical protein